MRRLSASALLVSLWAFSAIVARAQNSAQREKVAEGEYSEWKDGHPLKDTSQTWTIWRTPNGYEIEDKLPPDQGAALGCNGNCAPEKHVSRTSGGVPKQFHDDGPPLTTD
jgi:hypothetical protein